MKIDLLREKKKELKHVSMLIFDFKKIRNTSSFDNF